MFIRSSTNRQLNRTISELHSRSVAEKNRADTAEHRIEQALALLAGQDTEQTRRLRTVLKGDTGETPHSPGGGRLDELERLRTAVEAFRRQTIEIQAVISRLDIRESEQAWDLGAHIIALVDGPTPLGPPPRFCPVCQVADVEDYGVPIPGTDDSADCARCRRCGHSWAIDPGADGSCMSCGGNGHLGSQSLHDPRCPCHEDNARPVDDPASAYPGSLAQADQLPAELHGGQLRPRA